MTPVSKYAFGLWPMVIMLLGVSSASRGSQGDDVPPAARMAIHEAQQLMEKDRFAEAAAVLERFTEEGRRLDAKEKASKGYDHYLVHFTLGNCWLMGKNHTAAETHYRAAVSQNPHFHAGWMNLAKCCYDMNAHGRAGHAFLKGYETAPKKDSEILYYGAACFMTAGDSKSALGAFQILLKEHPPAEIRHEWKEVLVQAYLDSDQPRKALPFIEALSEKTGGGKRRQWQEARLHTYLSLNMKADAREYLEHLILEYPEEPGWWKGLAHLYLKENDYRSALIALRIKGFLECLTDQEEKIVADLNMALDVPVQAVWFYEKLARGKPQPDMAYQIAQGYIRLHRPEKALEWVEKALAMQHSPRLVLLKGDLLYQLKRYPEAAQAYENAASQQTKADRAWLMAGYAAWNAKDLRSARRAFQNAARYSSQKDDALKALRQLDQETTLMDEGDSRRGEG